LDIFWHWLLYTPELLQRICVVVVAAFISIRWRWLRAILHEQPMKPRHCFIAALVFGGLGVMGTHSGIVIDIDQLNQNAQVLQHQTLRESEAIIGFRDVMVMMAGVIGGVWVGLGAGLLAGFERYVLGGFAGTASGVATLVIGGYVGSLHYFRPQWLRNSWQILAIAFIGSCLHRLIIFALVDSYEHAKTLSLEIALPVVVINCIGCLLFFWVVSDLDKDRLENEARAARIVAEQSRLEKETAEMKARAAIFDANQKTKLAQEWELQALRARIEPHFLNNALNTLNSFIDQSPDLATQYVSELAQFFNDTRHFSECNTVSLRDELDHVRRYLTLERPNKGDKLQDCIDVPTELLDYQVLPSCILILVENALKHAFVGTTPPFKIAISAEEHGSSFWLYVNDNGRGVSKAALEKLAKEPVQSTSNGGGVALCLLSKNLALVFGDTAHLTFQSVRHIGLQVCIQQPKRSDY
jgi:two-component system sensor histidine kinase LytS